MCCVCHITNLLGSHWDQQGINIEVNINTDHFVTANERHKKWAYDFSSKALHGLDDIEMWMGEQY
jgi:hypothetical protein